MKVLHINQHLEWTGGIETYLLSLLPQLEQRGHEQYIAFSHGDGSLATNSMHLPEIAQPGRKAERTAYDRVSAWIKEIKPDVAHIHQTHNVGAVRACVDRVPTVLSTHDYRFACPASTFYLRRTAEICTQRCGPQCFTTTLRKHCLTPRPMTAMRHYRRVRWFQKNSHRFAQVIGVSRYAAERFIQAGAPQEKVSVVPYFCPLDPAEAPSTPPNVPTVIFVGRLRPIKGYLDLVKAIGRLPGVRAVIVGDWTSERQDEVRTLAASLNCLDRVEMRPWVARAELAKTLREATLLAFPSIWAETLGISGIEAQAIGVPVVACDVGGVREWVRDGETGLLAPPKNPNALAAAIRRIVESESLHQRLAGNALAMIREKFSLERHLQLLLDVYEGCGRSPAAQPHLALAAH